MPDRDAAGLSMQLFGPFVVRVHGAPLPRLRSQKGLWLLALLTLRNGVDVERSWLAGLLWPDSPEPQALANLRNSLTDLRRALGPEAARLRSLSVHALSLDLSGTDVDVIAFDAAAAIDTERAREQAVALYRGPLLEGCAEEWAFQERETRQQTYLTLLERLAQDAAGRSDESAAERYLRRAVTVEPARESTQRSLMQALAGTGNYAAAIHAYRELRLTLHREFNAEPDPETQALFAAIRAEAKRRAGGSEGAREQHCPATSPQEAPAIPPSLPRSLTSSLPHAGPAEATVTFLFTDIEGSTRLWEEQPERMRPALARHDTLLRAAIETHGGEVFKTVGDAFCAAFATATKAVDAALAAQRSLHSASAESPVHPSASSADELPDLRVRVVLHTGTAEVREGDFFGPALNRVARLLEAGHGGQVLLSGATQELVADHLPPGTSLRDLGKHRLRDLQRPEQVFQLVHPELPSGFPPLRTLNTLPNNLPQPVTSFVGREREVAEVTRLLGAFRQGLPVFRSSGLQETAHEHRPTANDQPRDQTPEHLTTRTPEHRVSRLVTLTGVGGTGKTRLALAVAAEMLEREGEGVWWIDLAPLPDPTLVSQAMATVLGIRTEPGRPLIETLVDVLRDRRMLLVLDNCEHLLDEAARVVEALLRGCPHLHVLASSREGLAITGEQTYRVPSLSVPASLQMAMVDGPWLMEDGERGPLNPQPSTMPLQPSALLEYEAVRLFVERARSLQPAFALTPANAAALVQICQRLDGIPFAIELAAARVKVLSVEQVLRRLDDRFRLLTGGSRTALPRQQTLRALIDWSYDLLDEAERALLCRLSVFSGGWTLEAAEGVLGAECWVVRTSVSEASMHAGQQTPEPSSPRPALSTAFRPAPSTQHPAPDVLDLLSRLVDKSLVQYEEQEGEGRYRLLETIRQYGRDRLLESGEGPSVRERHADYFLEFAEEATQRLHTATAPFWLGRLEAEHDNLRTAFAWFEESGTAGTAAVATPAHNRALLRLAGALVEFWYIRGHFDEGRRRLRAALERAGKPDAHGHAGALAGNQARIRVLIGAGRLDACQGDYAAGRACLEEASRAAVEIGYRLGVAQAHVHLAAIGDLAGDFALTHRHATQSVALFGELGDRWGVAYSHFLLAQATMHMGDYAQGEQHHHQSLATYRAIGDKLGIGWVLTTLAVLTVLRGETSAALPLLDEGEIYLREVGEQMGLGWCYWSRGLEAYDREEYPTARGYLQQSRELFFRLRHTLGGGFALVILGHVARREGDLATAHAHYRESLSVFREERSTWGAPHALEGFAALAMADGEPARAARLWGAAETMRVGGDHVLQRTERAQYERDLAAARAALGEAAFTAAWNAGQSLTLEEAVAFAVETPTPAPTSGPTTRL